jgi:ATP-binding cassette subfamily B protein
MARAGLEDWERMSEDATQGQEMTPFRALDLQLRRLAPMLREEKRWFLLGMVFVTLGIGLTLIYPQVIRIIIDEGIENRDMSRINVLALLMVGILAIQAPASYLHVYFFDVGARKITTRLQEVMHRVVMRQEMGFFDAESAGALNARLGGDTYQLSRLVSVWVPESLRFVLVGLIATGIMIYTSPLLSLTVVLIGPPIALGTSVFGRRIHQRAGRLQTERSASMAIALESVSSIRTVRAYDREEMETSRYVSALDRYFQTGNKHIRAAAMLEGITTVSGEAAIVLGIWLGGAFVIRGSLSPGELISFIFYAGLVIRSFRQTARFFAELMRSVGSTERIFEIMAREPDLRPGERDLERVEGRIDFESVEFSYPTRPDVPVLRGVDLAIRAGEFIAIVGSSGSGKSTLGSLIVRFYDPTEGRILIDGVDVRELGPACLRRHVTLVSQDSSLFARTIDENVRYGTEDASAEEVDEALRLSRASEFVDKLPKGLQTPVGDRGVVFSGGQRQRLAIARALLRKPRILILDEATSAIDSESEEFIKDGLRKLSDHPTIIIVAHRLSTVVDVDRVVVVEDGRVVAVGPHRELLETSTTYRDLVETQLIQE